MSSQLERDSNITPVAAARRPIGRPFSQSREIGTRALIAAVVVGAAVGAAAAFLLAPESGRDTRGAIARGARRLAGRDDSAWRRLRKSFAHARRARVRLKQKDAEATVGQAKADVAGT